MRTPYYREQALEGIACEVITAYDPNLYYGVPRMIPIEDIIEAQGITLEYQCLRKTGCVLGETIFDDGGTIIYDYDTPSKHGVQSVTWDWDYDRIGVVHGHYFMENYDGAKQDFATRSGLIQKEQLFSPEQLTEIYRCCTDSVNEHFFELTDKQVELIHSVQQQIEICVPDLDERVRQQEEALERASQEQTM